MSLLGTAIVTLCMGTQGNGHAACTTALDAGTRQSGFDQQFDLTERYYTRQLDSLATDTLGSDGKAVTGGMILIMKTATSKTILIPIPSGGYANSILGEFKPDSATLMFKWNF